MRRPTARRAFPEQGILTGEGVGLALGRRVLGQHIPQLLI